MKTFEKKKLIRIEVLTWLCDTYADLAYKSLQVGSMEEYESFRQHLLTFLPELEILTNCKYRYPKINI
ncbi:MAG: hypothetical protein DBY22_00615 [Clostridiales bacterium]|nr:MAG: hypothetical protein DBY22_00615 [Clostridiales bacterium]